MFMKVIKLCVYNKRGSKQELNIQFEGQGDCYICEYDPIENRKCDRFYEITIITLEVEKE